MVKPRIKLYLLIVLFIIALGGIFFFYSPKSETTQVFPATVNRDCAPWDGSAFTVTVQYDAVTEVFISIWRAPDIKFPSRYTLSDDDGQVGHAYISPDIGAHIALNGEVFLQSVSVDKPVEGRFNLKSERGERFEGRLIAKWGNKVTLCG